MILVAVPLIFEIAFVFILVSSLTETEAKIDAQLRRQAMVEETLILFRQLLEGSVCSFNALATMKKVDTKPIQSSITKTLKNFDVLVGEDEQLKDYALDIRKSTRSFLDMLNRYSETELPNLLENFASGGSASSELHSRIAHLDKAVQEFSESAIGTNKPQTTSVEQDSHIQELISFGVLLNLGLTIILCLNFARNISHRLTKLAENTKRVSLNQAPLPLLTGNDEISNLDLVIHRMAEQLQAAESQRRQLTSMLHSKLQEPLSDAKRVFMELQESAQVPQAILKHLKKSEQQLQRLINLLNDLTQVRQVCPTEIELNRKEILADELANRAIEEIQSLAKKKQLSIDCSAPKLKFVGDDERLTQILINLLSNAVKFSPQQAGILVKVTDLDQDVEFRVIDHGPGILEDQRAKIFERFEQISREDATRHGGTGLGLNICLQIAAAHGGMLGVDSEAGKGSEFWLRIPASLNRQNALRKAAEKLQSINEVKSLNPKSIRFKIWHKGLMVVAAPLVFQIVFLSTLNSMISKAQTEAAQEMQSMKITGAVNELYKAIISMSTSSFACHLSSSSSAGINEQNYQRAITIMLEQFGYLFEQEAADLSALKQLQHIFHASQRLLLLAGKLVLEPSPDLSEISSLTRLRQEATIIQKRVSAISSSLSEMLEQQKRIELKSPIRRAQTKQAIEILILGAVAATVLLSLSLGVFFSRNISRRVNILIENTLRFTKGDHLLPALPGNDELNTFDSDFRLMVKKIEENQEFKRQIMGVVSHELRAPLSSIAGALSLTLAGVFGELPNELWQPIQSTHDDIWRIVQLVNDLLDIERIEAGKYPTEITLFDIKQVAEQSIAEASKFLPQISFVINKSKLDDGTVQFVEADPDLSSKAITKLLLFSGEGQTKQEKIELELGKEGSFISIKVAAPATVLALGGENQVLEKFQLLDDTRQRRGVALSLTLTNAIATLLGGSLTAFASSDNAPGYFKILLPSAKAETSDS